jgi:hypothetical protein
MPDGSETCVLGQLQAMQRSLEHSFGELRRDTRDDIALLRHDLFDALDEKLKELRKEAQPAIDSDKFWRRSGQLIAGVASFFAASFAIFKGGQSFGWWR